MGTLRSLACLASACLCAIASAGIAHANDAAPPAQLNVRFSWQMKGEYAAFYVALDKGYFTAEGIKTALGEGSSSQAALVSVTNGQDQIAVLPGIFAIEAVSKGMPAKLIALYNPVAPNALISRPDHPIHTPKDLDGKIIGHSVGDVATTYLGVLCTENKVDCQNVKMVTLASQARVPALVAHKVDGVSVYLSNDLPILWQKFGRSAFVVMDVGKWGLRMPGLALVASNSLIAAHPDQLARFIHAVNRGVADCQKDPAAAAQIMLKYWHTSLSPKIVTEQVKGFDDATGGYAGKPKGWIDPAIVRETLVTLASEDKSLKQRPLDTYYTNALLDKKDIW